MKGFTFDYADKANYSCSKITLKRDGSYVKSPKRLEIKKS